MTKKNLTELQTLDNYGYNRDYKNNCLSKTIKEDIIFLMNLKDLNHGFNGHDYKFMQLLDLYLSGSYGNTKDFQNDKKTVKYILKNSSIPCIDKIINILTNAIYYDCIEQIKKEEIKEAIKECLNILYEQFNYIMLILKESEED